MNIQFSCVLILGFILSGSPLCHAVAPVSILDDPGFATALQSDLNQWQQMTETKASFEKSFQALEVKRDPEREDLLWWNPLWQTVRQNQAQEANRLLLNIQTINRRLTSLQPSLLNRTTAFAFAALEQREALTTTQSELWLASDQWRIPILLEPLDWTLFKPEQLARLSPELQRNRIALLQAKKDQWQALDSYLDKAQSGSLSEKQQTESSHWMEMLREQLEQLDTVMTQADKIMSAPKADQE